MATGGGSSKSFTSLQEKVTSQLTCPVCLELFTNPKTLVCLHSFCLSCLRSIIKCHHDGRSLSICCPTCRKYTRLPKRGGVAQLPTAFYLNNLMEELKLQDDQHIEETSSSMSLENPSSQICSIHPTEERRIFCKECQELLCINCALSNHRNHNYDLMENVHQENLKEFEHNLTYLREEIEDGVQYLQELTEREKEVDVMERSLKKGVDSFTNDLIALIQQNQKKKHHQIDLIVKDKKKALSKERSLVNASMNKQEALRVHIESIIEENDSQKLLAERKAVGKEISLMMRKNAEAEYNDDDNYSEENNVVFITNSSASQTLGNFGYLVLKGDVDYRVSFGTHLMAGQQCLMYIYDSTCSSLNGLDRLPKLTCTLTSSSTGHVTLCEVGNKDRSGRYPISFIPTTRGKHLLNIIAEEIKIKESYSIQVHPSPFIIDKPIVIWKNFNKPTGIAFGENGSVFVVENGSNTISKVSSMETGAKQLYVKIISYVNPWGIALSQDGKYVYVTDEHRLRKIELSHEGVVASIGGPSYGHTNRQLYMPKGVAVEPRTGRVYVADSGNHRIVIFDKERLTFLSKFGEKGSKLGQLYQPTDLVFDKSGDHLYVVNHYAYSVDVFTPSGQPLRRIGPRDKSCTGASPGTGELSFPMAITIDAFNNLYVTEVEATSVFSKSFDDSRISVYRTNGTFIRSFGRKGKTDKDLCDPSGITINTEDGNIYICDTGNGRVIVM